MIEAAAEAATRTAEGIRVSGQWGSIVADRVLFATGAFGGDVMVQLLGAAPDIDRQPRTHLLAELAASPSKPLPSLIVVAPPDERLDSAYWVPPVRYPDGRTYLKIGGTLRKELHIDEADLVDWFHGDGDPVEAEALRNSLEALLPDETVVRCRTTPCVYTGTDSTHPYIGWVDEQVAMAIGGNGSGAKGSDELGRLASTLFSPKGWTDEDFPASEFTPVLR